MSPPASSATTPSCCRSFDDNKIAIAADDVAQESRAFRVDASETGDPMMALAQQFADQDYDVLLYDEHSNQNRRADYVVQMVKESGAQGLVLFMQQFCDPEEMEYPYLKKALDDAGIPHIKLGVDQQMRDFGQASTAIQALPTCCKNLSVSTREFLDRNPAKNVIIQF